MINPSALIRLLMLKAWIGHDMVRVFRNIQSVINRVWRARIWHLFFQGLGPRGSPSPPIEMLFYKL